jgi:C-terminal processing protease CtpA/Prc
MLLSIFTLLPLAQAPADLEIDAATRGRVVDAVLVALREGYVFPDLATAMEAAVREREESGQYEALKTGRALAGKLQSDLRAVCNDRHLSVRFSPEPLPEEEPTDDVERAMHRRWAARHNFGFERVERLAGNVGYLDLRAFQDPSIAAETAAAAMTFLANTDALIVDLRQNGGGSPAMVAFLTSYLFGDEPVHLNDLYNRQEDFTHQWWTLPHVPGRRFGPHKPVYVLTSDYTFSAAEEFTYNLKNLGRATIVGEKTGGGAHPVDSVRVHEHFAVVVPVSRAINPVSKTNWEGTGIEPDVEVRATAALTQAHLLAIEARVDVEEDEDVRAELLQTALELDTELQRGGR